MLDDDMEINIIPKPVVGSDSSKENHRFIASINPLIFIEADDRFNFGNPNRQLTPESVLKYLASETFIPEMSNIKNTYSYIAENATSLFIVPAEYKILEKIIRPLKNALGAYIIGNAFETIALCGTVCEMITIFVFEINELTVKGNPISNEAEQKSSIEEFENMSQNQRVKKLYEFGLIEEDTKTKFDNVRKKRNEYLHRLSKTNENVAPDAKVVFDTTLEIFLKISGVSVDKKGKFLLSQKIIDYLYKKGLIEKVS